MVKQKPGSGTLCLFFFPPHLRQNGAHLTNKQRHKLKREEKRLEKEARKKKNKEEEKDTATADADANGDADTDAAPIVVANMQALTI